MKYFETIFYFPSLSHLSIKLEKNPSKKGYVYKSQKFSYVIDKVMRFLQNYATQACILRCKCKIAFVIFGHFMTDSSKKTEYLLQTIAKMG